MLQRYQEYYSLQDWFSRNQEFQQFSKIQKFEQFLLKCTKVFKIERAGIWFFSGCNDYLIEDVSYDQEKKYERGNLIFCSQYPLYFDAIKSERFIAIADTLNDERTKELSEHYFKPRGIKSRLDVPLYLSGKMCGIVCLEKVGEHKNWDFLDHIFAMSISDFVARIIENEKLQNYQFQLKDKIKHLKNDLDIKDHDLKDAQTSLDLTLESAQLGKWDWNMKTGELQLNSAWYTRLGYEPYELPQTLTTFRNTLHPDDVDRVFNEIQNYTSGKISSYETQFRMIKKDGSILYCYDRGRIIERDENGIPVKLVGINIDISSLKKYEQRLKSNQKQLKSMVENLPIPVAMLDTDFNYLAYSDQWKMEWGNFIPVKNDQSLEKYLRPQWKQILENSIQENKLLNGEDLMTINEEEEVWVQWATQPWKKMNNKIGGIIVVAENITHKKNLEMKISHTSKLTALGEMAGGIAHEINNPLSIIKGYVDLITRYNRRDNLTKELLEKYLSKIDETVFRISKIVQGMKKFTRNSSFDEKVPTSLKEIINETLDICQQKISQNNIEFELSLPSQEILISCRAVEISQVMINIINNSIQEIASKNNRWIKLIVQDIGHDIFINFIDSGDTISEVVERKLFQPFFTTKEVGVGTGLGLSISKSIIEEHEGTLFYDRSADHTTFVMKLPKFNASDFI